MAATSAKANGPRGSLAAAPDQLLELLRDASKSSYSMFLRRAQHKAFAAQPRRRKFWPWRPSVRPICRSDTPDGVKVAALFTSNVMVAERLRVTMC